MKEEILTLTLPRMWYNHRKCQQHPYFLTEQEHKDCGRVSSYVVPLLIGLMVAFFALLVTKGWYPHLRRGLSLALLLLSYFSLRKLMKWSWMNKWYYYEDLKKEYKKQGFNDPDILNMLGQEYHRKSMRSLLQRPARSAGLQVSVGTPVP